ncbi:MAG: ParB/RepB/Spo0J family partition protein [Lachnospiraceae bacterium]|nr:ParB/RepB/Spo0J family partition protein [Lachnospiraceae bacterium]MBR6274469.1 ParB/RepB/Spo0J family partition protein [Lachnospiraceae bacterium]
MAKKRVGRGLDSLISNKLDARIEEGAEEVLAAGGGQVMLRLSDIEPNREQPRKVFEDKALEELADSIKRHGIVQPIIVRQNGSTYEIIAGERRWRAARLAGLTEVPVIIGNYSKQEAAEIALIENIQRQNLNAIEEAVAYQKLINEYSLKQEEVAERVSKNRSTITNSLRLLKLDDRVKQMVIDEQISAGHARALLSVKDNEKQVKLAYEIMSKEMSVRDAEQLVKQPEKKEKKPVEKTPEPDFLEYEKLEEELGSTLGTKVNIKKGKNGKGRIEIDYYSQDELERLLAQFGVTL